MSSTQADEDTIFSMQPDRCSVNDSGTSQELRNQPLQLGTRASELPTANDLKKPSGARAKGQRERCQPAPMTPNVINDSNL